MGYWDISVNFFLNVISGILGILLGIWIERSRKPKLRITVGKPHLISQDDILSRPPAKWLVLEIHNSTTPKWIAWLYNREIASACRASISFYHLDGHRVYDRQMQARWSGAREPTIIGQTFPVHRPTGPDLGAKPSSNVRPQTENSDSEFVEVKRMVDFQNEIDIIPGETTNLDVVFRIDGDSDCYGWNNESYLYDWKHPKWKLEKGRYIAKVTIKTGGTEFSSAYLVVNDVPFEDFRLEQLDSSDLPKLKL
jgi:hypothetical protein